MKRSEVDPAGLDLVAQTCHEHWACLCHFPSLLSMSPQCYTGSLQRSAHTFKSSKKKAFFQYLHIVLKCSLIESNWVTSPSSSQSLWKRKDYSHNPTPEAFIHLHWMDWKYAGGGPYSEETWSAFIRRREDEICASKNSGFDYRKW